MLYPIELRVQRRDVPVKGRASYVLRHRLSTQNHATHPKAEWEGFEPSIGVKPYTRLAGERLQPLGHHSSVRQIFSRSVKEPTTQRRRRDSNPRCFRTAVFKTAAFDRSATPPHGGSSPYHGCGDQCNPCLSVAQGDRRIATDRKGGPQGTRAAQA